MENLNKDLGPVRDGCGARLFIWREIPSSPYSRFHMWSAGTGSSYFVLPPSFSSEGCVLFHINDKERSGSKKSLSYTHLFKKSQPHNTVGGSPQESSESWGGDASMTKDISNLTFFYPPNLWNKGYRDSVHRSSFT